MIQLKIKTTQITKLSTLMITQMMEQSKKLKLSFKVLKFYRKESP